MQGSDGTSGLNVDRRHIRAQALTQPDASVEEGLWQWPEIPEYGRPAVQAYWNDVQRDKSPAYDLTLWGRRAFLEPISIAIANAHSDTDGLGWLQVLLDLIEQQGLRWREHRDPSSNFPILPHDDGMPPVPRSELRATAPEQMLGHSPYLDRSNLSLSFRGTGEVGVLIEVLIKRVPGIADAEVKLIEDRTAYVWRYNGKEHTYRLAEQRGL